MMLFPVRYAATILWGLTTGIWHLTAQTFTFTTLAGAMQVTNDGINGIAQFSFPSGSAVDKQGNLFVTDTSTNTIRKVTPVGDDWAVTTIAGVPGAIGATNDGVNEDARFYHPEGVVVETNGNVLV